MLLALTAESFLALYTVPMRRNAVAQQHMAWRATGAVPHRVQYARCGNTAINYHTLRLTAHVRRANRL